MIVYNREEPGRSSKEVALMHAAISLRMCKIPLRSIVLGDTVLEVSSSKYNSNPLSMVSFKNQHYPIFIHLISTAVLRLFKTWSTWIHMKTKFNFFSIMLFDDRNKIKPDKSPNRWSTNLLCSQGQTVKHDLRDMCCIWIWLASFQFYRDQFLLSIPLLYLKFEINSSWNDFNPYTEKNESLSKKSVKWDKLYFPNEKKQNLQSAINFGFKTITWIPYRFFNIHYFHDLRTCLQGFISTFWWWHMSWHPTSNCFKIKTYFIFNLNKILVFFPLNRSKIHGKWKINLFRW